MKSLVFFGGYSVMGITQMPTDGVHCQVSASTGPAVLKLVLVTGAACSAQMSPCNLFSVPIFFPNLLLVYCGHVRYNRKYQRQLRLHPVFAFCTPKYCRLQKLYKMRFNVCFNEMAPFGPLSAFLKGCSSYGRNGGQPTRGDG